MQQQRVRRAGGHGLYTADERRRRDASRWTLVQGVLAPLQFLVFLISLGLVLRYLATGEGLAVATASVVVKTLALYTIMVTGSIWEKEVFGRYLFARPSSGKTWSACSCWRCTPPTSARCSTGSLGARQQMLLALAAYADLCRQRRRSSS